MVVLVFNDCVLFIGLVLCCMMNENFSVSDLNKLVFKDVLVCDLIFLLFVFIEINC